MLLALLQAFGTDVPVQVLLQAADVFGIDENRTRVALHRLRAGGLVESVERGSYRVTAESSLESDGLDWRRALERLVPWEGRWVGVHTAALPRADKTVARRRDRALQSLGFRAVADGLSVRPDNLASDLRDHRRRLERRGLEPEALVVRVDDLGAHAAGATDLWRDLDLDARYRRHTEALTRATLELQRMPVDAAARLAFQLGGRAVLDLLADPLLPEGMIDPGAREAFVETLVAFDEVGRDAWSRLLATDLVLHTAPTVPA